MTNEHSGKLGQFKRTKCYCNTCQGERLHEILCKANSSDIDDETGIGMYYYHEMLQCCGCQNVVLRRISHFSEDAHEDVTVELFPPSISRRSPRWLDDLKEERKTRVIHDLLVEVYIGVQNGMRQLATMGIRSVLELVMIRSVGDQGRFKDTLASFAEKTGLSGDQVRILETVLDAGHAAVHREYQPTVNDLHTCIDIAEAIVQSVYILPKQAAELKKRVPKRKRTQRTKK